MTARASSLPLPSPCGDAVIEVPLLLGCRDARFLEREARRRRQTAAQLIRHVLRRFVRHQKSVRRTLGGQGECCA
jgi:hypothetical protein